MGLTLSHITALQVMRRLRADGVALRSMDHVALRDPRPWKGSRWTMGEFSREYWPWPQPSKANKLHVLVGSAGRRIYMDTVQSHVVSHELPASALLFLDENTSIVSPELLFMQMAHELPLAQTVLLGCELCGSFTRDANNPVSGPVIDHLEPATSVEDIRSFMGAAHGLLGAKAAKAALAYVRDHAASFPEAVLATVYGLPDEERGYGMGPLTINKAFEVQRTRDLDSMRYRIPDIMFSFAPIGINYDGESSHLDLKGLEDTVRKTSYADAKDRKAAVEELEEKHDAVRSKVVDDMCRNRELLTKGYLVLPATKEDLYGQNSLDSFTAQLLMCAKNIFHVDVARYEAILEDYDKTRDRRTLLNSLLYH